MLLLYQSAGIVYPIIFSVVIEVEIIGLKTE